MGFLLREPLTEVRAVAAMNGRVNLYGQSFDKARVWLLEDRTAVICSAGVDGIERRKVFVRQARHLTRDKMLVADVVREMRHTTLAAFAASLPPGAIAIDDSGAPVVELPPGDAGRLLVDTRGCGCGYGAVGTAGPIEGPFEMVRVREPDWLETVR
jgi:hypothetical protein